MRNKQINTYYFSKDGKTGYGITGTALIFSFDAEDYDKIKSYTWYQFNKGVKGIYYIGNRYGKAIHSIIMETPKGYEVDHIDMNPLNNCRSNLRICTHQQNQCNQNLQKNNTSGVIGVRFYKPRNKYVARIKYWGKDIHLGYYINKTEAMQARNEGAKLLFGEFAILTDVPEAPLSIKKFVYSKCSQLLLQEKKEAS